MKADAGNTWAELASQAGVDLTFVRTDQGGAPSPVFHLGPVDRSKLEVVLSAAGVVRYAIGNEEMRRLSGEDSLLARCLAQVDDRIEELDVAAIVYLIGLIADVTDRTVRRWIAEERLEGEDTADCLYRLWHGIHWRICHEAVDEQRAGIMAECRGVILATDLKERLAKYREHWLEHHVHSTTERLAKMKSALGPSSTWRRTMGSALRRDDHRPEGVSP